MRVRPVAIAIAIASSGGAMARADQKAECIKAYVDGQTFRKDGKLEDAKKRLEVCSQKECPKALSTDCTTWLAEVDATLAAQKPPPEKSAAPPIESAPATAVLTPAPPITIGSPPSFVSAAPLAPIPPRTFERPVPGEVFVFGGVGLVAFGGFAAFGLTGLGKKSSLDEAACKPNCPESETRDVQRSFLIADICLGTGVVSVAIAAALFFTRPEVPSERKAAVRVRPTPSGVALVF